MISVKENISSILKHAEGELFQPFFTAKLIRKGTGLGLSYNIAKAHVGEIKVDSKDGIETVFTIQLNAIS